MQHSLDQTSDPSRSLHSFAAQAFLIWTLGSLASRWVGIWPAVGGTAVLLGAAALLQERTLLVSLLKPDRRGILLGLAGALVMLPATYLLYGPASMLPFQIPAQTEMLYARFRDASPLVVVFLLPFCVLAEELIWRGVVQEALTRRLGPWPGMVLAALAYAAAQVPVGLGLLPVIGVACGLFWGLLRLGSRGLVAPLVCHMLWDVVVFSLFPLVGR